MIELYINNKKAIITPGQSIELEILQDLLNFDVIESVFTRSFELLAEENQHIFNFPHDSQNTRNDFIDYENSYVNIDGNYFKSGVFRLANANERIYKGTFRTKAGAISANKGRKIGELIEATIGGLSSGITAFNGSDTSVVYFPFCHFWGESGITNALLGTIATGGEIRRMLPWVRIKFLLEKIFEGLGFQFIDSVTTSDNDFDKIIIPCIRQIHTDDQGIALSGNFDLENHVPDITLGDFLKAVRKITCGWLDIDNDAKTAELINIGRIIKRPGSINFSEFMPEMIDVKRSDIQGFYLKFKSDGNDFIKNNPSELIGNRLPDINGYFTPPGSPDANDYVLAKHEGNFYKYIKFDQDGTSRWIEYAIDAFNLGDPTTKKTEIELTPVKKSENQDFEGILEKTYSLIDNGSGKCRLSPVPDGEDGGGPIINAIGNNLCKITNKTEELPDVFVTITAVNSGSDYFDIDLNYTRDIVDVSCVFRRVMIYNFPVIKGLPSYPEKSIDKSTVPFVMAVWLGEQALIPGIDHPMASPNPYDNLGNQDANLTLNFSDDSTSLYTHFWKPLLNRMPLKEFESSSYLNSIQIGRVEPGLKYKTKKALFLIKRFSAELGISEGEQEIEGYII